MSSRYTAGGRRKSSMTHAEYGHTCSFCGRVVFGNGGQVSHSRGHVRRGEAVELVKWHEFADSPSRVFIAVGDAERIAEFSERGYASLEQAPAEGNHA